MAWFTWRQNNSGGYWAKPAIAVCVEAETEAEALKVAKSVGVDEAAPYCSCCGTRWSEDYPTHTESKPTAFGAGWGEDNIFGKYSSLYVDSRVPTVLFVSADGKKEEARS